MLCVVVVVAVAVAVVVVVVATGLHAYMAYIPIPPSHMLEL